MSGKRAVMVLFLGLAGSLWLAPSYSYGRGTGTGMGTAGGMMDGFGSGFMWFGGIGMVLFWVLVILAIAALVRWVSGRGGPAAAEPPTALNILKQRYARGEIDREEFEQRRRDLEGG